MVLRKTGLALSLATLLVVGGTPKFTSFVPEKIVTGTARIDFNQGAIVTAVIIGNAPNPEGSTKYFFLTCAHGLNQQVLFPSVKAEVRVVRDPNTGGEVIAKEVEIINYEPDFDFLVGAFEYDDYLTILPTTRDDVISDMQLGDKIYHAGCDVGSLPVLRAGVLGLKVYHDTGLRNDALDSVYERHPDWMFAPSLPIFTGSSGGGIFREDGTLIGMVLALPTKQIDGVFHYVYHKPIAIKTHIIRRYLEVIEKGYVFEKRCYYVAR